MDDPQAELESQDRSEEARKLAEHRLRMRFGWDELIEELIQEGQENGVFDNLPGKGKPLKFENDLHNSEWQLAHKIMKHNDVVPAWIADRNEVLALTERLRHDIGRRWQDYRVAYELAQGVAHRRALASSWERLCQQWGKEIGKLNRKIDDFNLRRPGDGLEMFKLRLDEELQRAGARRHLGEE